MSDENKVICIGCLEEFNWQDTQHKNGGRVCDICGAIDSTADLQDEKQLDFND